MNIVMLVYHNCNINSCGILLWLLPFKPFHVIRCIRHLVRYLCARKWGGAKFARVLNRLQNFLNTFNEHSIYTIFSVNSEKTKSWIVLHGYIFRLLDNTQKINITWLGSHINSSIPNKVKALQTCHKISR